jgi:hypothetical protein
MTDYLLSDEDRKVLRGLARELKNISMDPVAQAISDAITGIVERAKPVTPAPVAELLRSGT